MENKQGRRSIKYAVDCSLFGAYVFAPDEEAAIRIAYERLDIDPSEEISVARVNESTGIYKFGKDDTPIRPSGPTSQLS